MANRPLVCVNGVVGEPERKKYGNPHIDNVRQITKFDELYERKQTAEERIELLEKQYELVAARLEALEVRSVPKSATAKKKRATRKRPKKA